MKKRAKKPADPRSPHKGMGLRHRWEALARSPDYAGDYGRLCALSSVGVPDVTFPRSALKDEMIDEQIRQRLKAAGIVHSPNPDLIPSILEKAKQKAEQECKESGWEATAKRVRLLMERHLPEGNFIEGACVRLAPYRKRDRLGFTRGGRYLRVELDLTADPEILRTHLADYLSVFGGQPGGLPDGRRKRSSIYQTELDPWECYDRLKASEKTVHALVKEDMGMTVNATDSDSLRNRYKQFNAAVKKAQDLINEVY